MRHPKADEDKRRIFREKIEKYERSNRQIVYIDESGFATDTPRTHGYSDRRKRCYSHHDRHARGRINVIGALLAGVLLTVGLTEANVDAGIFNAWLQRHPENLHQEHRCNLLSLCARLSGNRFTLSGLRFRA